MKEKQLYKDYVKRLLDIFMALGGLLGLSPVMVATAMLVRIKLGSPVIFTQERPGKIGKDGKEKIFRMYKFRSMTDERDEKGELLPDEVRLTSFGKKLRATSLDELPEMFNILKGDMAIIGPRPALWNQYDLIEERDKYGANDILPGLTGWAQIHGRDELEIPEKAKLDGYYVENLSFGLDVKCFFGTILSVLRSDGVVEGGTGEMKRRGKK